MGGVDYANIDLDLVHDQEETKRLEAAEEAAEQETCEHESLTQLSSAVMRWTWNRHEDGHYDPEPTHDKILSEETLEFKCAICDEIVSLDDDLRLDES